MQNTTWTPAVTQDCVSIPHQTLCNMQYYPVSQPLSSSANFQSNQTLQLWKHGSQCQLVYMSPASANHPPPNMSQQVSRQVRQLGMFMVSPTHESHFLNPSIHRNYIDRHFMRNVRCARPNNVPSNTNSVYKNSCFMYGSPFNRQCQGLQTMSQPRTHSQQAGLFVQTRLKAPTPNMYQEQMSIVEQHNETPSSVAEMNNIPTNSLLPSEFRTSGQRLKKVSPSLPQDKIQSQTTTIIGNLSETNFATFNATPSSTQSQVLKSNNMSGLTMNAQEITSISTSTSHIYNSRGSKIRTGSNLAQLQNSHQDEIINWGKQSGEVQSCIDVADSQTRMVQQVNKVVDVVLPSTQQVSNDGNQGTTSILESILLKTDIVNNGVKEYENMEKETFQTSEDPCPVTSTQRLGLAIEASEKCTSENNPMSGSQRCEISLCENIPGSVTVSSNECQDSVCEFESSPEDSTFNLSTVPVVDYTFKELKHLVNSLESSQSERDKSTIDVKKCILDLYYDGDQKNLLELLYLKVELREIFKNTPELFVEEMHAVVFQYVALKHLKMLNHCSQILENETNIQCEDFRSSWLNVDGQPADIEKVLAEPISDYNLTWCEEVQQSVSESAVDDVDSPAQTGTNNSENLGVYACIDIPKTTIDNMAEGISHSNSEHSAAIFPMTDCNKHAMTHEKGHVSTTSKELCRMPRESRKRSIKELNDEVEMVKENERAFTEPTLTRSSDECKSSYSNVCEKTDASDDEDTSGDLPKITLLSSEDARKIFSECSEHESEVKPLSDLKFTCPHVTDLTFYSDFFCPSCLYEAKVLDLDEAESLPEPNMDYQGTCCSPQSGITTIDPCTPVCLDSYSIVSSRPESDGTDGTTDPNQGDQAQISSPPHAQELHHEIAGSNKTSITESVAEDHRKTTSLSETNSVDLKKVDEDSQSRTKISTEMVSPSRNLSCTNVKSPKTGAAPDANNLVNPDFVIKNTSTHKEHPRHHTFPSRGDRQCRDESRGSTTFPLKKRILDQHYSKSKSGTPSQTPKANKIPKGNNVEHHKRKRPVIKEKRQVEPSKRIKLELYGFTRSDSSSRDEKKTPSTPIYLNVPPNNGKSYTDEPSAKQKVYKQWSNTFVHPQNSFSSKKSQKQTEDLLKLKIQTLKSKLKDRSRAN